MSKTLLSMANEAMRRKDYEEAIPLYVRVQIEQPMLSHTINVCLQIAQNYYCKQRYSVKKKSVAVCGWELAHNAAGRVYTLATIYKRFADVEIIGSIFPNWGNEIWKPIRQTEFVKNFFVVNREHDFLGQALDLVLSHPYDIVHLSKPRGPNIIFGILYKLIWNAQVLVDIDDEELAIVGAETSLSLNDYIIKNGEFAIFNNLTGKDWTRLGMAMVENFDGITVSNPALQSRYGGDIVRHARDEEIFKPSLILKNKSRERFSISSGSKVILFLGTPRRHKGLIETAKAISKLNRADIKFVIVGNFYDAQLKKELLKITGVNFVFMPDQPINQLPDILAIGDVCVLFQDINSKFAQYQIPAKLTDALAMGVFPIVQKTLALADFETSDVVYFCEEKNIDSAIENCLSLVSSDFFYKSRKFFVENLSISSQLPVLNKLLTNEKKLLKKDLLILREYIFKELFCLGYSYKSKDFLYTEVL